MLIKAPALRSGCVVEPMRILRGRDHRIVTGRCGQHHHEWLPNVSVCLKTLRIFFPESTHFLYNLTSCNFSIHSYYQETTFFFYL